jgi:hypothetical protein
VAQKVTLTPGQLLDAVQASVSKGDPVADARFTLIHNAFLTAVKAAGPNPNWDDVLSQARNYLHEVDQRLAGRPPGGDWYDGVSNALRLGDAAGDAMILGAPFAGPEGLGVAAAGAGAKTLSGMLGEIINLTGMTDWVRGQRADYTTATQYDLISQAMGKRSQVNEELATTCATNSDCAKAFAQFDPVFAANAATFDPTPKGVVEAHPDVFNTYIKLSVQADPSLKLDVDQLRQSVTEDFTATQDLLKAGFTEVKGALADINATLGDLKGTQKSILTWITDQDRQKAAAARAAEAQRVVDLQWQAAASALGAISAIAKVFDPKLGADVAKFGGAGLQVLQAGSQLVQACTLVSQELSEGLKAATALGSAVATGNFIGAAFQLISLFTDQGPSPDQMILQQIDGLRTQINDFHADVDARLDRVDHKLNVIYQGVMTELGRIDWQNARLTDTVADIATRLTGLTLQLTGLEAQIISYFQTEDRAPLRETIDDALTRTQRNLPMTASDYAGFEAFLHEWVLYPTGQAWSPVEQPSAGRLTDDAHLAAELGRPLATTAGTGPTLTPYDNLSYIKQALADRGLTSDDGNPLPNPPLPNPLLWGVAAASFAHLQQQYSSYAAGTPASWWDDVAKGGNDVGAYLRILLGCQTVFTSLLDDYKQCLADLGTALNARVTAYITQYGAQRGRRVPPVVVPAQDPIIDPWAPPQQAMQPPFHPTWLTLKAPQAGLPDLNISPSLLGLVPLIFLNKDWFTDTPHNEAGQLAGSYTLQFDQVGQRKVGSEFVDILALGLTASVRVGNLDVVWVHVTAAGPHWVGYPPKLPEAWQQSGASLQAKLAGSLEWDGVPPPEQAAYDQLVQQTTTDLQQRLATLRSEVFIDLAGQCAPGASAETEAARVDGIRALLDTLITLVFEQVRQGDDLIIALLDGTLPSAGGVRLPSSEDIQSMLTQLPSDDAWPGDHKTAIATWISELAKQPIALLRQRLSDWQDRHVEGSYDEWYAITGRPQQLLQASSTVLKLDQFAAQAEEDIVAQLPSVAPGTTGPEARRVQALLRAARPGSTDTSLAIDGIFGPKTTQAIRDFQQTNTLPASGTVDEPTWRRLLGV